MVIGMAPADGAVTGRARALRPRRAGALQRPRDGGSHSTTTTPRPARYDREQTATGPVAGKQHDYSVLDRPQRALRVTTVRRGGVVHMTDSDGWTTVLRARAAAGGAAAMPSGGAHNAAFASCPHTPARKGASQGMGGAAAPWSARLASPVPLGDARGERRTSAWSAQAGYGRAPATGGAGSRGRRRARSECTVVMLEEEPIPPPPHLLGKEAGRQAAGEARRRRAVAAGRREAAIVPLA